MVEKLDMFFPFLMFAYGAVMTLVLNTRILTELAERRLPYAVHQQMMAHRALGLFCLIAGGLWSLQNLWL